MVRGGIRTFGMGTFTPMGLCRGTFEAKCPGMHGVFGCFFQKPDGQDSFSCAHKDHLRLGMPRPVTDYFIWKRQGCK
jgi:hypothetical protein